MKYNLLYKLSRDTRGGDSQTTVFTNHNKKEKNQIIPRPIRLFIRRPPDRVTGYPYPVVRT